jgi:FAD/FMN-containing dehydrogenase
VTIDLRELGRVLDIDKTSRAARIEAGAFGPALEAQLKPHGLTLRHFPQSFECSTLGGWIATRSGGHFANGGTVMHHHAVGRDHRRWYERRSDSTRSSMWV